MCQCRSSLTSASVSHRESPFATTNNSGGGFGEGIAGKACCKCTMLLFCIHYINSSGLSYAVGDNDLVRIEVSRYESEESSGAVSHAGSWQSPIQLHGHQAGNIKVCMWAGAGCVGIYNSVDGTCMPIPDWARRSGPRRTIYHDPRQVWQLADASAMATYSNTLLF